MKKEEPAFRIESSDGPKNINMVQMNISGVSQNTETHLISITEDKLRLIIINHHQKISKSRDWAAPLGILITLVATLLTANFKDFLFVDGTSWHYIFLCCAAISGWLTFTTLLARLSNKTMSVKDVVDTVANRKPLDD